MTQMIYGDEAGFTGNNLLDPQQPIFAYATVAIDPQGAAELVAKTIRDFRIAAPELKGKRLITSNPGRKAIASVLEACLDRGLVAAYHKRYTLASKFFEHIFEPVLADQKSIFYGCGFHRFISGIIYLEALTDSERAQLALDRFQQLMRERDPDYVDALFPLLGLKVDTSAVLSDIETFAVCHRDKIADDVAAYGVDNSLSRWMLDVSVGALWNLLQTWGERFDSLTVCCDESNPLFENRAHFDVMIGRTDKKYMRFEGKLQPLIFNLSGPLQFGSSHQHAGIQIADLFATTATHVLRNGESGGLSRLKELIVPAIHIGVFPDTDSLNLQSPQAFANWLVLRELVERSLRHHDLFDGIPEFFQLALEKHVDYIAEVARI